MYFAMPENAWDADGPLRSETQAHRDAVQATWERFLHGDAAYRKARWKVIPGIPEGAWVVQNAFGNTPTLLANKLTHTWHSSTAPAIPDQAEPSKAAGGGLFHGAGGEGSTSTAADATAGTSTAPAARTAYGQYLEVDCDVRSSTMAKMLVDLLLAHATDVVINLGFLIEAQEEDELPEHLLGAAQIARVHATRMTVLEHGTCMAPAGKAAAPAADGSWGSWLGFGAASPAK